MISNEGNKEFQLELLKLNQVEGFDHQVLQSKTHASQPKTQQMNLACTEKCILNYNINDVSLKGNMEIDIPKHTNLDVDTFEYNTQNSTAFQSTTLSSCDEVKFDTLSMHSKV